jgi:hypothetical protein
MALQQWNLFFWKVEIEPGSGPSMELLDSSLEHPLGSGREQVAKTLA